jgi:hypothetical protein
MTNLSASRLVTADLHQWLHRQLAPLARGLAAAQRAGQRALLGRGDVVFGTSSTRATPTARLLDSWPGRRQRQDQATGSAAVRLAPGRRWVGRQCPVLPKVAAGFSSKTGDAGRWPPSQLRYVDGPVIGRRALLLSE